MRQGKDIEEILTILDDIIETAGETGDRAGLFAALYRGVTRRVKVGIAAGIFDDGERMQRLDVIFANRYFAAYDTWRGGGSPTRAWKHAFEALANPDVSILQHLLLGMNAHINLDLGLSAAQVAPGAAIEGLRGDFDRINTTLASMLDGAQRAIAAHSPVLGILDLAALKSDEAMVNFSIRHARDEAWETAEIFADVTQGGRERALRRLDRRVASLARLVAEPGGLLGGAMRLLRASEDKDVPAIIWTLGRLE